MPRVQKKALRERWSDDENRSWSTLLGSRPRRRFFLEPANVTAAPPVTSVDGEERSDLRGIVVHEIVEDKEIVLVDFTAMRFVGAGQFNRCLVRACIFDGADVDTNLRKSFERCSFVGANLKRAVFGEQFEECDFTKAKLGSSGASGTLFRRCRFDGADLRGAHLMDCTFEACTFAETRFGKGSLSGSTFVDSELPTELLADTILDRVRGL